MVFSLNLVVLDALGDGMVILGYGKGGRRSWCGNVEDQAGKLKEQTRLLVGV